MSYKIIIPNSVEKELNSLPESEINKIVIELNKLSANPYLTGSKKLTAREGWRIQVGDYRVIYDINKKSNEIYLRKIAHRKDIYK